MWAPRLKLPRPKRGPVLGTLRTPTLTAKAAVLRWGLLRLFTVNVCVKKLLSFLALIL